MYGILFGESRLADYYAKTIAYAIAPSETHKRTPLAVEPFREKLTSDPPQKRKIKKFEIELEISTFTEKKQSFSSTSLDHSPSNFILLWSPKNAKKQFYEDLISLNLKEMPAMYILHNIGKIDASD